RRAAERLAFGHGADIGLVGAADLAADAAAAVEGAAATVADQAAVLARGAGAQRLAADRALGAQVYAAAAVGGRAARHAGAGAALVQRHAERAGTVEHVAAAIGDGGADHPFGLAGRGHTAGRDTLVLNAGLVASAVAFERAAPAARKATAPAGTGESAG